VLIFQATQTGCGGMSKVVRITRVQKLPTSFAVIHAAPFGARKSQDYERLEKSKSRLDLRSMIRGY
jgi:hypothetical protein